MTTSETPSFTPFRRVLLLWLLGVTLLGTSGRLAALQPPLPQLLIVALTLALIAAGAVLPGFRDWLAHVSLRAVVAFHLTRYVGIAFLVTGLLGTTATLSSFVGAYDFTLGTLDGGANYALTLAANSPTFAVTQATPSSLSPTPRKARP